jgi:hypothetical protein
MPKSRGYFVGREVGTVAAWAATVLKVTKAGTESVAIFLNGDATFAQPMYHSTLRLKVNADSLLVINTLFSNTLLSVDERQPDAVTRKRILPHRRIGRWSSQQPR